MTTRLTKHRNGAALVLDQSLMELLNIDFDTPLDVSVDGGALVVTPVRDEERKKSFEQAIRNTNGRYGRALRRLAE